MVRIKADECVSISTDRPSTRKRRWCSGLNFWQVEAGRRWHGVYKNWRLGGWIGLYEYWESLEWLGSDEAILLSLKGSSCNPAIGWEYATLCRWEFNCWQSSVSLIQLAWRGGIFRAIALFHQMLMSLECGTLRTIAPCITCVSSKPVSGI